MQTREGSHFHEPGAATQNCGNSLGSRPSVRISQLYLRDNSGDALKAIIENQDTPSPQAERPRSCSQPVQIESARVGEDPDTFRSPSFSAPATVWTAEDLTTGRNDSYSQWYQPIASRPNSEHPIVRNSEHSILSSPTESYSQSSYYASSRAAQQSPPYRDEFPYPTTPTVGASSDGLAGLYDLPRSYLDSGVNSEPAVSTNQYSNQYYYDNSYMSPTGYESSALPDTSYHTPPRGYSHSTHDRYHQDSCQPSNSHDTVHSGDQQVFNSFQTPPKLQRTRSDHLAPTIHRPRSRAEVHRAKKHDWFKGSQAERILYGDSNDEYPPEMPSETFHDPMAHEPGCTAFTPSELHKSRNLRGNGDIICWSSVG